MTDSPLTGREGLRVEHDHPLVRALHDLAKAHDLQGAVLISFNFGTDRVGVNSTGEPARFGRAMEELGDRILALISDGTLDPSEDL